MFTALIGRFAELVRSDADGIPNSVKHGRLAAFFRAETPQLDRYMALDDTAVWAEVGALRECSDKFVAELARRLVDRDLYKCFDFGSRMQSGTDQAQRFALAVKEAEFDRDFLPLLDGPSVQIYKSYDFESDDPLNKVMVDKTK